MIAESWIIVAFGLGEQEFIPVFSKSKNDAWLIFLSTHSTSKLSYCWRVYKIIRCVQGVWQGLIKVEDRMEDGYRCHQLSSASAPPRSSLAADLFWSSSFTHGPRLEIYSLDNAVLFWQRIIPFIPLLLLLLLQLLSLFAVDGRARHGQSYEYFWNLLLCNYL